MHIFCILQIEEMHYKSGRQNTKRKHKAVAFGKLASRCVVFLFYLTKLDSLNTSLLDSFPEGEWSDNFLPEGLCQ